MKFLYAQSFLDDFDNKLLYFKDFDKLNLTSLEKKLYYRIQEIKTSLSLFPQMGRLTGRIRVLSLGKNKKMFLENLSSITQLKKIQLFFLTSSIRHKTSD